MVFAEPSLVISIVSAEVAFPVKAPTNVVAVRVPFAELNVRLVPDFGARSPVAAVENKTLQDVSDDSSAAVTDIAVVAVPIIFALNLL